MAEHHPTPANPMSPKRVPVHPAATVSAKAPGSAVSGKAPVQPVPTQAAVAQPAARQNIAGQGAGKPSGQASVPVRRLPTNAVPSPSFVLQPMIHVTDMAASVAFYEQLGGSVIHGGRDAEWVLMQLGTTQIVLLARPPRQSDGESTVELNFLCTVPLDRLAQQLHRSGAAAATLVTDPTFGLQLHVQSPDGLLIRINEVDPDPLV